MSEPKTLGYFINGKSEPSTTEKYYDITDPNTGEVIAKSPCCTVDEVNRAVEAAQKAFPAWRDTPVMAAGSGAVSIQEDSGRKYGCPDHVGVPRKRKGLGRSQRRCTQGRGSR